MESLHDMAWRLFYGKNVHHKNNDTLLRIKKLEKIYESFPDKIFISIMGEIFS